MNKAVSRFDRRIHTGTVYLVDGNLTAVRPGGDLSDCPIAGWWRANPDHYIVSLEFHGWRPVVAGGEAVSGFSVGSVAFPGIEAPEALATRVVAILSHDPRASYALGLHSTEVSQ